MKPPRLAAVVVLPTPPLVEMMDTTCMGFSSSNGMNREEASGAFFEALGDPLFDLHRVPAHRAHAQAQRLGELAFLHQAVDVRALEAGLGFDLGAAQDAVLGRCRRGAIGRASCRARGCKNV